MEALKRNEICITRCRDCRFRSKPYAFYSDSIKYGYGGNCCEARNQKQIKPDGYCSFGEDKDFRFDAVHEFAEVKFCKTCEFSKKAAPNEKTKLHCLVFGDGVDEKDFCDMHS